MAFSQYTQDTDIIASLPDDPNDSGGLSSGELKQAFDQNAANIAAYLNDTLIAELNSSTSGSSGADHLGYGGSIAVDTVKEALDLIYSGGSGAIPPDNTITTAKIVDEAVTLDKLGDDVIAKFDAISKRIDENFHDDYMTGLTLYYSDLLDDNVDYSAMCFDGLQDTDNVDTANTTAYQNTTLGIVQNCYTSGSNITPAAISLVSGDTWSNLSYAIDGNESTRADNFIGASFDSETSVIQLTLPDIMNIQGFKALTLRTEDCPGFTIYNVSYSQDQTVWHSVSGSISLDAESTPTWYTVSFGKQVKAKYIKFTTFVDDNNSSGIEAYFYEFAAIGATTGGNHVLQSKLKFATDTVTKAKLYLSVKEFGSATATPTLTANGTNYESLTLLDSNTDPLDSFYTEKEYAVTFANAGASVGLKIVLAADGTNFAEIKKYCIIFE